MPDDDDREPGGVSLTYGSLRHRVRYRLDNLLARGTWAALVWLGIITFLAILISALLLAVARVTFTGSTSGSWVEDAWQSLLRILDTGTMAADTGWGPRILALVVTIFGVLVAGTLIGIIASGVEDRIVQMRRGRSVVIESDHVVVLGSSDRLPILVEQLVLAGARRKDNAIVVLADADPTEMYDDVRRIVTDRRGSRLVFRSGDPTRGTDLVLAHLAKARTVIVLGGPGGEAATVKTVLAVGAQVGGFDRVPIVAELDHPVTAQQLVRACGGGVHPIIATEAAARSAAFALREHGLSQVLAELFDFRGDDLYLPHRPELVGVPFGEIINRFANGRPIGRLRPDGGVDLNPPADTVFEEGDRLAVITGDPAALEPVTPRPDRPASASSTTVSVNAGPAEDHLVVIGWNDLGTQLVSGWGEFAAPTSTVEIAYDPTLIAEAEIDVGDLDTVPVSMVPVDGARGLTARAASKPPVTTVVLLGYTGTLDPEAADSRTLLNLMALRHDLAEMDGPSPRVIVELAEVDNVPLAQVPGADDYLVSQALGSQFIAQLADLPERRPVFLALYDPTGPSIHLVSIERLGLEGDLSAAEIFDVTYRAGLIALGWRHAMERGGELVLNPSESIRVRLEQGDEIVVIG